MNARVLGASLLAVVVLASAAAQADVAPPNSSQCGGKKAGDTCKTDDGKQGTCVESTCSRLDYSKQPPGTTSYACMLCNAEGAGASSGGTSSGGSGTSGTSGTSGGSSATGGPPAPAKSGCAAAPVAQDGASTLVLAALGVALLVTRRRRGEGR